ncbi:MAG: DUF4397 domain-containing protein [Chitinophagaceae bacterium]|nr:DUF4397 domain-containing protein [Chitinophagaceae bacterium]
MKKVLSLILIVAMAQTSCTKETRPGPQAQVKFINASVNTVTAQVSFDEVLLIGTTGFAQASNYAFVNVGSPTIKVQATSSTSNSVLVSGSASLQSNFNYTLIAADSTNKLKISVLTDDLVTPATGKASLRFLHLAGNAPALNIDTSNITVTGGILYSNRVFNDQTTNSAAANFISVNAATYTFKAKDASGNILFTKSINLASGRIYSIVATGAVGATAASPQVLGFTVFTNN